MIVCAQCGERNAPGAEFCGSCGTYLEWEPKPAGQPPGGLHRAGGTPGGQHQGGPPPGWQAQRPVPPPGWPGPPPPGRPPGPPPGPPPPGPPTGPPPQGPPPVQPGAMQPTDQRQAPPGHKPRLTERRAPQAGDLICGQCGEANAPTRKFCSRCGSGLVEAQVVREKWWRRIFPKRQAAKAGTRHRRRTSPGKVVGRVVRWALAVLLLGGIGLYGLVSPFRQAVNEQVGSAAGTVKDWFTNDPKPVRPSEVTATASSAGHEAPLAADNAPNTFWSAPIEPTLPTLVFKFDKAVDLERAIFRIGIGDKFQTAFRPAKVHLVYSTGKTFDLTLTDVPDEQPVKLENGEGAQSVELFIESTHRSLQGNEVAISEIEFFTVE